MAQWEEVCGDWFVVHGAHCARLWLAVAGWWGDPPDGSSGKDLVMASRPAGSTRGRAFPLVTGGVPWPGDQHGGGPSRDGWRYLFRGVMVGDGHRPAGTPLRAAQDEAGGAVGAAEAFAELLTDRLRVLGPDHPDTLTTRSNLARWRGEAGDAVGAAEASEDLLEDMVRVLGPDHPHTLTTRNNLAYWMQRSR